MRVSELFSMFWVSNYREGYTLSVCGNTLLPLLF